MAFDSSTMKGPGGVNVAECLRVADAVERSPAFDMTVEFHPCGTAACIFGHVVGSRTLWEADGDGTLYRLGEVALGIRHDAAMALFQPVLEEAYFRAEPGARGHITNAHAAACLRNLAATGEVDWLGTKPGAQS